MITDPKLPIRDRIKLLDQRELRILDEIKNLDFSLKNTEVRIKEILNDWAVVIEEQTDLGSYIKPIDTICSRIIQILRENDLDDIAKYTYTLPSKYKQVKYQHAGLYGAATKSSPFKYADSIIEDELENYRDLEKEQYVKNMLSDERKFPVFLPANASLDGLTKEEIRKRYELLKEAKSRIRDEQSNLEELIKSNNIALVDEELEKHISTEKPEEQITPFYNSIGNSMKMLTRLINTLGQLQEKVKEFPPAEEDAVKYADAFEKFMTEFVGGLDEFLKPLKDEKWSQSWPAWFKTAWLEADHGKHAAAKMSAGRTHTGKLRPLTREQVGDNREKVFEQALKFVKWVDALDALTDYHAKYIQPRILDRKVSLSPVLSEEA